VKDVSTNPVYNIIILALFIFNPMLIIAAFKENRQFIASAFSIWDNPIISLFGVIILIIGGFVTVFGRAQLSKYGSGVLRIKNDHRLITTGIFSYIRHPVYTGGLMGIIGIYLSFRSIIMLFVVSTLYFFVIRHRLLFEEQLLLKKFGEEYRNYMKRTKRLFPFLY
jgi:protein-S-isoprenylcysteine O-methyltransferase Ste14